MPCVVGPVVQMARGLLAFLTGTVNTGPGAHSFWGYGRGR